MLKDLFISKTRVKLLETFLCDPTQMYHVRDLVRKTAEEINAVRRELARMESLDIVKKNPAATAFTTGFVMTTFTTPTY